MGAIGGMLGLSGGAAGTGFNAPQNTNILNPSTVAQANTAYGGNQAALQQQQALLAALQGQQGIQNQSNVYGQLQNIAAGQGPNPAQAMLNQATGQNVANQAALAAGQRGAGSNVGLMARQAAQQGSNAQQQAAGQAATMQANQSLAALGQAGNMANQQVSNQIGATGANTSAQQAEQANLLNAISGQNTANVGMQSNINSNNASLANTMIPQQGQMIGGILNGASSLMSSMADGGVVAPPPIQTTPAPAPGQPAQKSGGSGGGGMASMLPMLAMLAADGLDTQYPTTTQMVPNTPSTPQSAFGKFLAGVTAPTTMDTTSGAAKGNSQNSLSNGASNFTSGAGELIGAMAKGGMVKALVSPGEIELTPSAVEKVKKGADPTKVGKVVPGKPKVDGAVNSYKNDTVPKHLAVGSIIVPRSETKSANPKGNSRAFVAKTLAKRPR